VRARWNINNHGWNSPIDYLEEKKRRRITVIGDSYIAAFQVDADKSYPSLLRKDMGGEFDVYSFGVPGAPLSQYLQMSRYVAKTFDPDIFIFNIIHNDFIESIFAARPTSIHFLRLKMAGDSIEEVLPQSSRRFLELQPKKKLLYRSSLVRYLHINLRINGLINRLRSGDKKFVANIDVAALGQIMKPVDDATGYVLRKIREENPGRRIIFVMDGPRNSIYDNTENSSILFLYEIIQKYCNENGFEFLNLTEDMKRAYAINKIKFNSDVDGHWNEYGHAFVAEKVANLFCADNSGAQEFSNVCSKINERSRD
jgi:lysophospholipase L1-like esterase